jgi:hypothetical protein
MLISFTDSLQPLLFSVSLHNTTLSLVRITTKIDTFILRAFIFDPYKLQWIAIAFYDTHQSILTLKTIMPGLERES